MILVAEQMAEMERRLLEQQADLESRQRELERGAGRESTTDSSARRRTILDEC